MHDVRRGFSVPMQPQSKEKNIWIQNEVGGSTSFSVNHLAIKYISCHYLSRLKNFHAENALNKSLNLVE